MEKSKSMVNKYASIMYRLSRIFVNGELGDCQMSYGQPFFLLWINEKPGIMVLELAQQGLYDKGTTTRAVNRLEELSYIRREIDETDKRVHRLYPTEKGQEIMKKTYGVLAQWDQILLDGFTEEEKHMANDYMERMAENAASYMKQKKERV